MGTVDRLIRVALAIGVAASYFSGQIDGITAIVLGGLAGVFAVTSFVGSCPLYAPFGISTK